MVENSMIAGAGLASLPLLGVQAILLGVLIFVGWTLWRGVKSQ